MILFFRRIFDSRFGVWLALGFVGLIAIAFASSDISSSLTGGGSGGGTERVAAVGEATIGSAALRDAATNQLEQIRQQDPTITMKRFIDEGGFDRTVNQLIDRYALQEFGKKHGMVAGDRLIDSEIAQIGGFKGADGKFSEELYNQAIAQQGLSDAQVREDIGRGLVAQQLLTPVGAEAILPLGLASRYVALLQERRVGSVALIPSALFAPTAAPTDKALTDYFAKNREKYTRPERRVLRYATFGADAVKSPPAPTEAEIAAAYEKRKAEFAATESRQITQLIALTEPAAKAIIAEVNAGKSLDAVAREKGLAASDIGKVSREQLTGQASKAVADAVFAAARGAIATPARSSLGWHVMRVDAIETKAGRSLADVRAELTAALAAQKQREALADLSERIEEQFDEGISLADIAKELGVTPKQTPALLANGSAPEAPGFQPDQVTGRLIGTAFSMEQENEPQLAELVAGQQFALFDVTDITPAAPPPMAQIKDQLVRDYGLSLGAAEAKKAADTILAALAKGMGMGDALAGSGKPIPPANPVDLSRAQLMSAGQVPPPLALMFSMAKGTAKRLEAPGNVGWFVVKLTDIVIPDIKPDDPMLGQVQTEFAQVVAGEYEWQFRAAVRNELEVERNDAAIKAMKTQLVGGN